MMFCCHKIIKIFFDKCGTWKKLKPTQTKKMIIFVVKSVDIHLLLNCKDLTIRKKDVVNFSIFCVTFWLLTRFLKLVIVFLLLNFTTDLVRSFENIRWEKMLIHFELHLLVITLRISKLFPIKLNDIVLIVIHQKLLLPHKIYFWSLL